jgi:hypothetical protein
LIARGFQARRNFCAIPFRNSRSKIKTTRLRVYRAVENSLELPERFSTFRAVKRNIRFALFLPVLTGFLGMAAAGLAQNNAAAVAAQEEAEDRYRRMAAQVTGLKEAQDLHQQQIASLEKSVRELSEQIARANNNNSVNNATQERLSQLAEQIRKVDEARVAENKKILETIDELHRILKNLASAPPPKHTSAPAAVPKETAPPANEEGFEYLVRKDDTLSGIVQAYRQQNIKVTRKIIMDANPTINWDRLRVGQKIFIPKPKS